MRELTHALAELTPRGAPERAVRRRAETVLAHLARVRIAVLIANNQGHFVDANAAAAALTGYSHAELLRLSLWDLTPNVRKRLGSRLWREFLARGRMSGSYVVLRKDGTTIRARYFAAANVLPGVHVSALAV